MTAQMGTLTYEEYQQVLVVLQRDAELRKKEQQRISKLVTSLGEESEKCNCCGDTLTIPSTRKCSVCARQREVKLQSGEWFYRQLQSRFNRPAITNNNYSVVHKDGAGMDPESAQVREFIERLVETLVSGQLDDVKVNRLYNHPEYDRMFSCHHTPLCEKLVRLSFALQMAIANKPLPDDETPSSVHAALKQQIQRILQEAMALPNLQNNISNENGNAVHHWDEDITTKTYEDILATAILNKVIQQFQQRNRNSPRFTEATFEDMDNNKNILQNSDMEGQNVPKFISTVEIGVNSSGNLTGTNVSTIGDRSWITSSSDNPMSMTIEECIEEVTTYDSVGEEEESSEDLTTSAGSELDFYLSGLNFIKQRRVPFPEFGMDIIDGSTEVNDDVNVAKDEQQSESSESPHPTDLVTPIDSWEENWLFQRRRLKTGTMTGNSQSMPVPMLVPNPSEDFRALIGDRDAEEVSDLSDCSDAALEDIVLADVELGNEASTSLVKDAEQGNSHVNENDLHESITGKTFSRTAAINLDNSRAEQLSNGNTGSQEEHNSMDSDKNAFENTTDEMEASSLELNKASSVECLSEFGQQDSEYTEDYASVTQRQLNSLICLRESNASPTPLPVPKPRSQQKQAQLENTADENQKNQRQSEETSDVHVNESDSLESSPPKPGTIAEREHRKWESAPPLPNNPYSPENISKRLSRKSLYTVSSASSRSSSVDFPELNSENVLSNTVAEPLHVICTSGDPDYKRYGRDYYINQSKSASGERKSHSRLSSPSSPASQQQYHQVFSSSENNVSRSTRVEKTRSMDNICLPSGLVENEVAKWQKEINQIEQRWLRKLQTNKTENKDANTSDAKHAFESNNPQLNKERELIKINAKANETSDDTLDIDNVDSVMNGTRLSVKEIKASLEGCKQDKKENHYTEDENNHSVHSKSRGVSLNVNKCNDGTFQPTIITNGHISGTENSEETTDKPNQKSERATHLQTREYKSLSHGSDNIPLNENPWRRTPSECSTVSSDLDLDADVPIVLPSVKELAKHFSGGGTTSDSDSSVSTPKGKSSTPRRIRNNNEQQRGKPVLIVEKSKQQHVLSTRCHQPVREVHSLTARSISRQFREGLRQNLPAHFDRNLHTQGGKLSDSGVQSVSSVISSCAENDNENFDNSMSDSPEVILSKSASVPVVIAQNEKFPSPDYGKKFSYLKNRISANNSKTAFLDNADISIGSVNFVYTQQETPMKYRVASYGNLSTNSDMDVGFKFRSEDTTPGYTSDESGTASPIPLSAGRRKLHSSIAFWEQLQQKSK